MESLTMSVMEAGILLGIGRSGAYKLVEGGVIPSIKVGKKIRIPRNAIEHMVNDCVKNGGQKTL